MHRTYVEFHDWYLELLSSLPPEGIQFAISAILMHRRGIPMLSIMRKGQTKETLDVVDKIISAIKVDECRYENKCMKLGGNRKGKYKPKTVPTIEPVVEPEPAPVKVEPEPLPPPTPIVEPEVILVPDPPPEPKPKPMQRMKRPDREEVREYFRNNLKQLDDLEADQFFDYYESQGWKVGKNPMKKWHNAASGWASRNRRNVYGHKSKFEEFRDGQMQLAAELAKRSAEDLRNESGRKRKGGEDIDSLF